MTITEVYLFQNVRIGDDFMVCPHFNEKEQKCMELGQKFYKGMQKPCLDLNDPQKCPILMMRG
ncbi:MAG: hypothetical protein ACFFB2_00570 [Promethearchaeota archaeon]